LAGPGFPDSSMYLKIYSYYNARTTYVSGYRLSRPIEFTTEQE